MAKPAQRYQRWRASDHRHLECTMADRDSLTAQRLRELLDYDPLTGVFTRRASVGRRPDQQIGTVAGTYSKGYVSIGIDGRKYMAHVLGWLHHYGAWPRKRLDHRDTVRDHNWIENLREATSSQNMQNQRKPASNNKSGFLGVSLNNPGPKWRASIRVNRKTVYLGIFDTPEQAHAAYATAKRSLHPFSTL